jgi:hypothetical protein
MKWLRILSATAVLVLASCSDPSGPRYPDPEDEKESDPTDPDKKRGFLFPPPAGLTFWV